MIVLLTLGQISAGVSAQAGKQSSVAPAVGEVLVTFIVELPPEASSTRQIDLPDHLAFFSTQLNDAGLAVGTPTRIEPRRILNEKQRILTELLLPEGVWRLDTRGESLFVPSVVVDVSSGADNEYSVTAETGGELVAKLSVAPDSEQEWTEIVERGEFRIASANLPEGLVLVAAESRRESHCPPDVADGTAPGQYVLELRCPLPIGKRDIRVLLSGFLPLYFWERSIEAGQVLDLGSLELEKGAGLVGWILPPKEESANFSQVSLRLEPVLGDDYGGHEFPGKASRMDLFGRKTKPNDKGFFRFIGLEPATYKLVALGANGLESTYSPIEIPPLSEIRLTKPLELLAPGSLTVYIEPPVRPDGEPWYLVLLDAENRAHGQPTAQFADHSGVWFDESLKPGTHLLQVVSGERNSERWAVEEVRVDGDTVVTLTLPLVEFEGVLSRAGQGVEGILWFGGRFGPESIQVKTDEEGHFHGVLPRSGEWPLDFGASETSASQPLEPVMVEAPSDGGAASLEIDLPLTNIPGRVVDESGEPVAKAVVYAVRIDGQEQAGQTVSDSRGEFEFTGVRPGKIWLSAVDRYKEARAIEIDLREGLRTQALELVLEEKKPYSVKLVGDDGPVVGAKVWYQPSYPGPSVTQQGVTGPDGSLTLSLPGSARFADVLVLPGSMAMKVVRIPLEAGQTHQTQLSRFGSYLRIDAGNRKSTEILLFKDGVPVVLLQAVMHWVRTRTGQAIDLDSPGAVDIPNADWGSYILCAVADIDAEEREMILRNGVPSSCRSGYLAPGGSLSLILDE